MKVTDYILYFFSIVITACAVEFYKKGIRGITIDNTRKTKAKSWEVYIVASLLSMIVSVLYCYAINHVRFAFMALATLGVYFLQYLIDTKIIKKALNSFIEKKLGK